MTAALILAVVVLTVVVISLVVPTLRQRQRTSPDAQPASPTGGRILFPFVVEDLSDPALDAALRLAAAEDATLVPMFLALVPLDLPLDTPLPSQCSLGVPLLDVIEQRATGAGVPVDSRIERGRNRRHALRQAIAQERFDRIVMAAASHGRPGFDADDVAWLIDNAPGEVIVLRPPVAGQREAVLPPRPRAKTIALRRGWGGTSSHSHVASRAGEMAGSR